MTLDNLCSLFTISEIVGTQTEIDRDYYSFTEMIYSDGKVTHHMTKSGLLHITKVLDANYIIFVDRNKQTYICIYKYTPETSYKAIIDYLNIIEESINIKNKEEEHVDPKTILDDVYDINAFTCTECDCTETMKFTVSNTNPEVLITVCKKCLTQYEFVPSKYYRMSSKKIVYHKVPGTSSRLIPGIDTAME